MLIATTEPELFLYRFQKQLGRSVFIESEPAKFLEVIETKPVELIFADFKALGEKWTGLRLLNHVRKAQSLAHVDFWMMADTWHQHNQEWVIEKGGKGHVKRSADSLAVHILSEVEAPRLEETKEMMAVDAVFSDFAGPIQQVLVDEARNSFRLGMIAPKIESYMAELASKLAMPQRRSEFLEAATAALQLKKKQ